ncbi:hypothetical protein IFM89_039848 [Coptis chinensis]|uniref:BRCT domain-containing protein n=1 Tax=Coptis chinensis TaxID=261450 RepID=A0A835LGZ0_9MAGN|nr:hypothetical protein IFM89_039848 [Coptis chinensis]
MRVSSLARVLYFFYSYGGRKFEHVLKHGLRNDLYVVTLGWFVDSVRKNGESKQLLVSVQLVNDTENSCLPVGLREDNKHSNRTQQAQLSGKESGTRADLVLSAKSIYVDSEISDGVRRKVINAATKGGVATIDLWFVGCSATHVVCDGPSIWRYLGHSKCCYFGHLHILNWCMYNPQWILKTVKGIKLQRFVHLSADLTRQAFGILEFFEARQENMTADEVVAAIHTDSKRADRLRSAYSYLSTTVDAIDGFSSGSASGVIFQIMDLEDNCVALQTQKSIAKSNDEAHMVVLDIVKKY